jgi:hypothetical protein
VVVEWSFRGAFLLCVSDDLGAFTLNTGVGEAKPATCVVRSPGKGEADCTIVH